MAKEVFVSIPHQLGRQEARKRVTDALERARVGLPANVVASDVAWTADQARVTVSALGQSIDADVEVEEAEVKVRVRLPWLLAALSTKISDRVKQVGGGALKLGYDPKKPG
jgi:phosphoglycerate-specific signal transduction histidine kinase